MKLAASLLLLGYGGAPNGSCDCAAVAAVYGDRTTLANNQELARKSATL
jgi:hypothetical protein